ncbi:hypothetical protein EGW08_018543 [Elysia chlorotica]|uniref:Uncharacterized protein n=1 Tax=Elysia chlorotica TaxID=188477 RepID=A0A3S0ZRP0_ELYCH|nr:hypothetical protein EGW08_018543 [Elysia chlorotica]
MYALRRREAGMPAAGIAERAGRQRFTVYGSAGSNKPCRVAQRAVSPRRILLIRAGQWARFDVAEIGADTDRAMGPQGGGRDNEGSQRSQWDDLNRASLRCQATFPLQTLLYPVTCSIARASSRAHTLGHKRVPRNNSPTSTLITPRAATRRQGLPKRNCHAMRFRELAAASATVGPTKQTDESDDTGLRQSADTRLPVTIHFLARIIILLLSSANRAERLCKGRGLLFQIFCQL